MSSLAEDREMASLYASAGVQEFWIVNANARNVEVYRQPANSGYSQMLEFTSPETLRCESLPGVVVELEKLFG